MSYSENVTLALRYQAGDTAAGEGLLKANGGLIAGIARSFLDRAGCLEMEDLLQEGRLGLLHAATRFDPERGCEFSTYAVPHVRQAISRAIDRSGALIRLPCHIADRARKAHATGEEGEWLATIPAAPYSLDHPASEEGTHTLADFIPADTNIEGEVIGREWTHHLLSVLPPRERAVLKWRLGWEGPAETLGEIGNRLQLSRERVRQIERDAVKRLRNHLAQQERAERFAQWRRGKQQTTGWRH